MVKPNSKPRGENSLSFFLEKTFGGNRSPSGHEISLKFSLKYLSKIALFAQVLKYSETLLK